MKDDLLDIEAQLSIEGYQPWPRANAPRQQREKR